MDLLQNPELFEYIKKVKGPLRIQINGVEMSANQKENITGYNKRVWFIIRAITNTIALKNLTEQYKVTYDINEQMFIVHTNVSGLLNMEFQMHDSGLHYYEPTKKDLAFLNNLF